MFCPAVFREDRPEVLRALIRAHPLGALVTHGPGGLVANLLPFTIVERDDGPDLLQAHLARANDQVDALRAATEALVLFQGPQAYITPSWYPTKHRHGRAVPTWNYVAIEVHGRPRVVAEADWLRAQIDALTGQQERHRPEPWSVDDAPAAFVAGQMTAIVGVEIAIERITGKWKVSQNQPAANRAGVLAGLRESDPTSAMIEAVASRSAR